jgi:hypothetical protein
LDKEKRRLQLKGYKKTIYNNRIAKGLCYLCGKPKVSKTMCQDCLDALKKRNTDFKLFHPEEYKRQQTMYNKKWHREALEKIASDKGIPVQCPCGCSDIDFLEIDHINNDGGKERGKKFSTQSFHLAIRNGKRKTDDLDIRCKVCNFAKYCSVKMGKGNWKITFKESE